MDAPRSACSNVGRESDNHTSCIDNRIRCANNRASRLTPRDRRPHQRGLSVQGHLFQTSDAVGYASNSWNSVDHEAELTDQIR